MALLILSARPTALVAAALTTAVLLAASPAQAKDQDLQAWSTIQATKALSKRALVAVDVQTRFNEDASRLGQLIVRPSVGWKLDDTKVVSAGYAYIRTSALGRAPTHEHRSWEQLTFRLAGDGKGPTLTGRTRLEQRWIEDRDGTGWRVRQQVRFTSPLQNKVRLVAWTEPFVGLNQTGWGQRDGLHLWRSFAGVSMPVSKTVAIEPGYLHQRAFRPGEDAVTHAASVTFNLQF